MMKTLLFTLCALVIGSCSKDEASLEIEFNSKSLSEIKSLINGSWRVHYTSGGIAGTREYPEDFFMYFDNDSVYTINEGVLAKRKVAWTKKVTVTGESTYIMENPDHGFFKVPHSIHNDTLFIYDNIADGYWYALTKENAVFY